MKISQEKNDDYLRKERLAALCLSAFFKISPLTIKKLLKYFLNLYDIYQASSKELLLAGLNENLSQEFINFKKNFSYDQTIKKLQEKNIQFVCCSEDSYPKLLKEIYDPPLVLYYQGSINFKGHESLAIVGSRKNTNYGKLATEQIVQGLKNNNLNIISGLAKGIDSLAHQAALKNNIRTIAVLGSGLDIIYPKENNALAKNILENNGAILSEFPPACPPQKHHFPLRNRIISGLSKAVLVVEAGNNSGSLITARQALDQNREILAIPGEIFSSQSLGTNTLIGAGAKLVQSSNDVLEIFQT